jgi:heme O synthase-like polyprenyltransferase
MYGVVVDILGGVTVYTMKKRMDTKSTFFGNFLGATTDDAFAGCNFPLAKAS